ncbi:MAG: ABC transporter permease, partial [Anaerolineae bacterium]|nr:ABC transporter permease [Anaerolineae bacterium]
AAATAQPQVIAAARRINTGGIISSREGGFPVAITGIEPSIEATYSLQAENITQGRFLEDGEGDVVVIGQELARLLDAGVGDRVTLLGRGKNDQMRQRTMTIVGIYSLGVPEAEKGTVFITLPEAQSLYNLRDEVTEVTINLQNVGQEQAVVPVLQAALPNVEIDTFDTLRPEIRETIASKLAFTSFFGLMVIFIASIGILNIQMMAVFERTREMGVLAALGMKGRQIMAVFLVEGTLIGALGALVGGILAVALLLWLGRVGLDMSFTSGFGSITALMGDRLYPSVSPTALVSRLITVVVIAAIASLYPAWQASRKQPAESLHHV